MCSEEYITIKEVAKRLMLKPKTVSNMLVSQVFCEGVHYFRPKGIGTRFKWSAVVAWLEKHEERKPQANNASIPMARGYDMGMP